jgi:hypothetical protein
MGIYAFKLPPQPEKATSFTGRVMPLAISCHLSGLPRQQVMNPQIQDDHEIPSNAVRYSFAVHLQNAACRSWRTEPW